jgi:hypothetical protein
VQLAEAFSGWFVTLPAAGVVIALIFLAHPARSGVTRSARPTNAA